MRTEGDPFKRFIATALICGMGFAMFGIVEPVCASSAINVHITPTTVTATGYNSAGGGYFWCTGTFENYNPFTGHWGVLEWNPKGTPEGEWTARDDDSDFSIDGQCKSGGYGRNVWLVHSSGASVKKAVNQSLNTTNNGTSTGTSNTNGIMFGDIIGAVNSQWGGLFT